MTYKTINSRHAVESCVFQLHRWKPFQVPIQTKTLESDLCNSKPYSPTSSAIRNGAHSKRPCLSDRATSFSIESLDLSKLSIFEDEKTQKRDNLRWIARKRRRRGSRSVSGRSSDKSGTRASVDYATCSDIPLAVGTDSSGDFFMNGDANWASDVSEAKNSRRERRDGGGGGERENLGSGSSQNGVVDSQGTESGYGSEPGYRGDAEIGYGDELDEKENEGRLLFWGERFGDTDSNMERVGENTFSEQKAHHRQSARAYRWRTMFSDGSYHWNLRAWQLVTAIRVVALNAMQARPQVEASSMVYLGFSEFSGSNCESSS
ncbi:hypothetical protein HHK36_022933 [Tetracentron sinense]|uniref:Uncharacterized protein n=1 Tax=Tetracentron sinense TaxID=13715 RepID=A0A834YU32_TETSI|nr:hypothetical protein HHK36_022933 [Tetracentron sinense]